MVSATCHIQLKVKDHQGLEVQFKLKKSTSLCKLMDAYCSRLGLQASQVRFIVNGERIAPDDTAEKLGLEDGDFIVAMEQTGAAAESDDEAISYGGSGLGSPLDEEAESAEEEIQERLDRNRELQSWIENELVRQRWQSEFEIAEELEREIRNQRWHEDLDREVEEMRRADEIESHFVRFVEPRLEPTRQIARTP